MTAIHTRDEIVESLENPTGRKRFGGIFSKERGMRIFTVAFFGHRYAENIIKAEKLLEKQIRKLIDENEYVDFLVGRNGDFDQCVSSSVLRVRKNYRDDNSALVLVLPYLSQSI